MSTRVHAALGIWRGRHARSTGDRAYFVYLMLLVALVAVVPVARLVWLGTTSLQGIGLLGSAAAPVIAQLCAAALWCAAMLLGRIRGPAVLSPMLTYALSTSDMARRFAFRAAVVRAGMAVVLMTALVTGTVAGSLLAGGVADLSGVIVFTAAGLAAGMIAAVAWLLGQALPRTVTLIVPTIITLTVLTLVIPQLSAFTPWGWILAVYPSEARPAFAALIALIAVAIVGAALTPMLLDRLEHPTLADQAARWDIAAVHAGSMDFSTAASTYTARPRIARRLRSVRPRSALWVMFLRRSAIGAARTPGRLLAGIVGISLAGILVACAFLPGVSAWMLGGAAGLLMFIAMGPLTDGIRHAAHVASDLPLYGIGDARLLALHAMLPALVSVLIPSAAALLIAVTVGAGIAGAPMAAVLGVLAVIGRVNDALKGPMPPELLTPIPTPMGDMAALFRLAWALDSVLLAALCGVGAALGWSSPLVLLVLVAIQAGVGVSRWRHRR